MTPSGARQTIGEARRRLEQLSRELADARRDLNQALGIKPPAVAPGEEHLFGVVPGREAIADSEIRFEALDILTADKPKQGG